MKKIRAFFAQNLSLSFILITMFLNFLGFSILIPVIPFLIQKYIPLHQTNMVGFYMGLLMATYAICQFLAAPGLGVLSDYLGRRPILLLSLFGSIIGYIFLGIGGSLGMLFIGRIIDGLTGGNISTVYAYVADITKPQDRGKIYGLLGAAGGFGFMIGPVIGGFIGSFSLSLPFYIGAGITALNMIWGYFVLPESLSKDRRSLHFDLTHLNPFASFGAIAKMPILRYIFLIGFLFFFPLINYQTTHALFLKDILHFGPAGIGMLLFVVGVVDIFAQGYLTHLLLPKWGEYKTFLVGLLVIIFGGIVVSFVQLFPHAVLMYIGIIIFITGDGLVEPALSGLIANNAGQHMQGRVQGANQSLQSFARIIGPLYSGMIYSVGTNIPYVSSLFLFCLSLILLLRLKTIKAV
ncbi:MAG: MFS transporter [Candidatus Roizmanbacteria bacterium]|nr:MFS transporter [Candidatus Roizmanbacteria bacterium]